jgi:hypothetical protein
MEGRDPLVSDTFYSKTASNLGDLNSASTARANLGLGTAATQASSAFDASGAATAAEAAAIAASLPTLATATAAASAPLAVNTVTQVTAASNLTMTLPSPVAGALIVVEREAASTANVAVTGNVRGVGSSTVTLSLGSESEMFLGTASTWNPVAGHKTLTSLDSRYGQLAVPSSYTADQYFGSGRPWFDVRAFGAAGNGATDDTLAIQTAINTALGLRTDTGVSMSGFSVTDPAAVIGDVGKYVNSPNYPLGCSHITAVTSSPVGYTVATAATASLSGQVVAIGTGSAVSTRAPAGPVYIPAGIYKVTSDLLIQSTGGFNLIGAGACGTVLQASGGGFTTAILNIDGSLDGCYGGFQLSGDGTEGTGGSAGSGIPNAVSLTWTTAAARSTSGNELFRMRVRNLMFVTGVSLAGIASRQLDGTSLRNVNVAGGMFAPGWTTTARADSGCSTTISTTTVTDPSAAPGDTGSVISGPGILPGTRISSVSGTTYVISPAATASATGTATLTVGTGLWQNGFLFGNGAFGNNYNHVLESCTAGGCHYGMHCSASGFALYGSQPAQNGIDFYINSPVGQITVENVQSQNSAQLIVCPSGASVTPVSFRDCNFSGWTGVGWSGAGYVNAWISTGTSYGNWQFENLTYKGGTPATPPVIDLDTSVYGGLFTLINIAQPNPPSTGIVPGTFGAGNPADTQPVICINYQDTTAGAGPSAVVYPFYSANANSLYRSGTYASIPAAATYGEGFYYDTAAGGLYHSNGSAWTTLFSATPATAGLTQYNAMYANANLSGYAAWSYDMNNSFSQDGTNAFIASSVQPSGKMKYYLFYLPVALTINGYMSNGWRANTGTVGSNAYEGLYQFPSGWVPGSITGSVTLLGNSSPDMSAYGYGPNRLSIGVTSLAAGWYAFGCVIGTQSSTGCGPAYLDGAAEGIYSRTGYGAAGSSTATGVTALPATQTISTITFSQGYTGWFAID